MKAMEEIRDAEAEKRNQAMLNVGEHWRVGHIAKTNFTLGFDCRDKLSDEALKIAVEALERYEDIINDIGSNSAVQALAEIRKMRGEL